MTPDADWFLGPEWPAGPLPPSPPCQNREAEKDRQVLCLYLKCTVFQRDVGWALTPRNHYDETCHWLTRNKDTDGAGARTIYTGSTDGTTTSHSSRVQRNTHGLGGGHAGQPLPSGEWVGGGKQSSRRWAGKQTGCHVGAWLLSARGVGGRRASNYEWTGWDRRKDCHQVEEGGLHHLHATECAHEEPPLHYKQGQLGTPMGLHLPQPPCDPGTPSALPSP